MGALVIDMVFGALFLWSPRIEGGPFETGVVIGSAMRIFLLPAWAAWSVLRRRRFAALASMLAGTLFLIAISRLPTWVLLVAVPLGCFILALSVWIFWAERRIEPSR